VKTIPLTQGKEALVDDCDYEYLMRWKWHFLRRGGTGYAKRNRTSGCDQKLMHRLIAGRCGLDVDGGDVDHIDGDGLNNQRSNLRAASRSQNNVNSKRPKNNTSGFKGVYPRSWDGKPVAQIGVDGRRVYLGTFDDPRDAARAYNDAALKYFGEFACLNPL
jgi:hypothetical protein